MSYFKHPIDNRLARYDHLIVHCTATKGSQDEVDAAWVDRVHKEKGWSGCGYHAVITRAGEVQTRDLGFNARPYNRQGAHVGGCGKEWNARSMGVSLAGGLNENSDPENNFTQEQFNALEAFIDEFLEVHPNPVTVKIMGHRDLIRITRSSPKACPCFEVSTFLSERNITMEDEDSDPDGQPSPLSPETHKVKAGDTLWDISRQYGVTVAWLKAKNNLEDDKIYPDQVLLL
ncbi:MAG: LysM peptidoglycan-binding domain-containing protein [Desulfobacteraceae bacterium]|nr:MAG: LysM peptidoglycan-binding domain-containing protein [Desulfobacteraceae bacterium]